MASVINTNIAATRTHNVYNRNNEFMNAAMTRVATGMKINSAKDGASTWAISEKMRERIRANDQANQNIQNDTALLKVAQGGVGNAIDILKTLKERAINSLNDSNMDADRDRIAVEVEQLLEQIDKNATTVKFNGRVLLDGTGAKDTTGGNFSASSASSSSSVTEPTASTYPANTTGNSAVLKNTGTDFATGTTNLTDIGFNTGDVITFSWKEDGGSAVTKELTVGTDANTVADLAFSESKLDVSLQTASAALNDQNNKAVSGTGATTDAAGLWAVGDKYTKITDFKVSVVGSDGATNTTAQSAIAFSGVQQSTGTVASHTYATVALQDGSGNAATTSTLLTALKDSSGTSLGIQNSDTLTISWKEDGTTQSATYSVTGASSALSNVIGQFTGNVTAGIGDGTSALAGADSVAVTDSSGNAVTQPAAGTMYVVGKEGVAITDISISKDGGTTNLLSFTTGQTAGDEAPADPSQQQQGGSGTTTALTFHIGGEAGMEVTANIGSMTVANLFRDDSGNAYTSGTFAGLFTKKSTAGTALAAIDKALDTALNEQTKLGAMENRLGYASDNITTMNENLEAADSVMRDSDIAKEMTSYMKYAVLSQASQYMLAQAGQNAYQVLNLLQQ